MQQKSEKFSEYSERTETLAEILDMNLSDLPVKLGISASMFHAYRSGKSPISPKAWRKLEAAERAAGVETEKGASVPRGTLEKGCDAESTGNPKDLEMGADHFPAAGKMMEDAAEYMAKPTVEAVLIRIAMALEEIARKLPPVH